MFSTVVTTGNHLAQKKKDKHIHIEELDGTSGHGLGDDGARR